MDLEAEDRAVHIHGLQDRGMDLPELGDHCLGAQLEPGGPAGAPPGRRCALDGLQGRGGEFAEQGLKLALQVEEGVIVPAVPAARGMGRDDGRDHRRLVAGLVAAIDRADLEQGRVGIAAPGVPPHRLDEVRQDGGPHAVQVRRDGVGQHQFRGAAAEPLGRRLLHEAPGHGFGKPRSGQGPAGNPHPALAHGQHAPRREGDRRQGGGGQGTVARDPRHFLDEVRPALDVPSPGGRRDGLAFEGKAQVRKDGVDARTVQGQPREGLDIGPVEGEGRRPRGCLSRQDRLGGLPAADVQDQPGRKFQAGK